MVSRLYRLSGEEVKEGEEFDYARWDNDGPVICGIGSGWLYPDNRADRLKKIWMNSDMRFELMKCDDQHRCVRINIGPGGLRICELHKKEFFYPHVDRFGQLEFTCGYMKVDEIMQKYIELIKYSNVIKYKKPRTYDGYCIGVIKEDFSINLTNSPSTPRWEEVTEAALKLPYIHTDHIYVWKDGEVVDTEFENRYFDLFINGYQLTRRDKWVEDTWAISPYLVKPRPKRSPNIEIMSCIVGDISIVKSRDSEFEAVEGLRYEVTTHGYLFKGWKYTRTAIQELLNSAVTMWMNGCDLYTTIVFVNKHIAVPAETIDKSKQKYHRLVDVIALATRIDPPWVCFPATSLSYYIPKHTRTMEYLHEVHMLRSTP